MCREVAQPKESMKSSSASEGSASELISKRIAELADWRGKTLNRMRKLIHEQDPDVVEEWKWMGTPIWSHEGIICTGESYKDKVKLTLAKGALLKDPKRLFNSSLDGNVRRAIDILEGQEVDSSAFKALVRQAIALNSPKTSKPAKNKESLIGSHECKRTVSSNLERSRSNVPTGKCPAFRAIFSTRQSEKPSAGRLLNCSVAALTPRRPVRSSARG
jgi:hypothetical protein